MATVTGQRRWPGSDRAAITRRETGGRGQVQLQDVHVWLAHEAQRPTGGVLDDQPPYLGHAGAAFRATRVPAIERRRG
jgi:hypothetical protein